MESKEALAATLGTEPQVVLLALRLLEREHHSIRKCLVFHTRSAMAEVRQAYLSLQRAWPSWGLDVPLEFKTIPVEDLDSETALRLAYRTLREGLQALKSAGFAVHLCISGGRKPIVLAAFLTAQFLFGPDDHLWYLYSPPEAEAEEPRVLLADRKVRLIEFPVPIWTNLPLFLDAVSRYRDPWTAAEVQRYLVRQGERQRVSQLFRYGLSRAEQEVVRLLVLEGGTNRDLARRLGKSPRTVGHQLASVYRKVRGELGVEVPVDRTTVASLFAPILRMGQMTDAAGHKSGDAPQRR